MIKSMTGFGRGSAGRGDKKIDVEIRTVNSRFFELKLRGLSLEPKVELKVRNLLEEHLQRGNVQVRIELNSSKESGNMSFNRDRFEMIQEVLKTIHVAYGQRMSLSDIITTSDLLKTEELNDLKPDKVVSAIEHAIEQVNEMRKREGGQIQKDVLNRVKKLSKIIHSIDELTLKYGDERQVQLKEKIISLLDGETPDENRLIQEVAYWVERSDVTEEIVRCKSHFSQLSSYLNEKEPVGKRINFLIQEIGREVNTIGSKSPQTDVTKHVVEIKDDLEKIREQAQNIH
ncbi:MAG: YicC/YloC family endoribonuclease [Candidatus Neomarinimicrobiota bacterium]|nr:YicC/YloC family endoribonuclease [Candidatus Neomarinimicrobiota bacterium]